MSDPLSRLFEPTYLGRMRLKNRLVMSPMSTNYATDDGFVSERTMAYYEARAKGGVGLIVLETTCVESPRGRGFDHGLVLDDDKFIPGFRKLARTIQKHGTRVAAQLHHAGSATHIHITHMQPVSASPIPYPGFGQPQELSVSEIKAIVVKFAQAAERAKKAGLDGVEIHSGHLYLFAQFLSPVFNKRQDMYGGSLENRARFLVETLHAIKESVGNDYPVWCRINGHEFGMEGGFTLEEAKQLAKMLEKAGADAIHVSAYGFGDYAGYNGAIMYDPPANIAYLAAAVKKEVSIPVVTVGRLSLQDGERLVQEGEADLIAMGRSLLADPDLPRKAAQQKFDDIRPCLWCRVCLDITFRRQGGIRCVVNAALGLESESDIRPSARRRRILVVGGGPAGMETARVAALRSHEVIMYEKEPELGGLALLAALPPSKDPVRDFTNYLIGQIKKLPVRVELGKEVDMSVVKQVKPDVVVLASGATAFIPKIPGHDGSNVVTAGDVLLRKVDVGKKAVIIGGGVVGCEVANLLSEEGKEVTILETLPELAANMGITVRTRLFARLKSKKVQMMAGVNVREISTQGVDIVDRDGRKQSIKGETIVFATGFDPNRGLLKELGKEGIETYLVGDCVEPRDIMEAVADAFHVARKL